MKFLDKSKRLGPVYETTGSNQIATFKNIIVEEFWKRAKFEGPTTTENYYSMNIAISKAVDSLVQIFGASFTADREMEMYIGKEALEEEAAYSLKRMLIDEIGKTDRFVGLVEDDPFGRGKTFSIQIPFIFLDEIPKDLK